MLKLGVACRFSLAISSKIALVLSSLRNESMFSWGFSWIAGDGLLFNWGTMMGEAVCGMGPACPSSMLGPLSGKVMVMGFAC